MNPIEVEFIEPETYGRYHFRYLIKDMFDKYHIEIFGPSGSHYTEVLLRIYDCWDYERIYPDLNFILNLHPSLGHILVKNIDILRFDVHKNTIYIDFERFQDSIKPYFKVVSIAK